MTSSTIEPGRPATSSRSSPSYTTGISTTVVRRSRDVGPTASATRRRSASRDVTRRDRAAVGAVDEHRPRRRHDVDDARRDRRARSAAAHVRGARSSTSIEPASGPTSIGPASRHRAAHPVKRMDADAGASSPARTAWASCTAPGVSPWMQIERASTATTVPSTATTCARSRSHRPRRDHGRVGEHAVGLAPRHQRAVGQVGPVGERLGDRLQPGCVGGRAAAPSRAARARPATGRTRATPSTTASACAGSAMRGVVQRAVRLHVRAPRRRRPGRTRRARRVGRAPRRAARRGRCR